MSSTEAAEQHTLHGCLQKPHVPSWLFPLEAAHPPQLLATEDAYHLWPFAAEAVYHPWSFAGEAAYPPLLFAI